MKSFFASTILVLTFCAITFAQTNETSPCPTISVMGSSGIPTPDEPMIFTAEVSNEAKKFKTEYKWTVTNGEIIEGQGTTVIKVLWKDMFEKSLLAEFEVIGLPKNCVSVASETASTICPPQNRLIDEISEPISQIEKARVAAIIITSQHNPNAQVYVVVKHKKNTSQKTATQKEQEILDFFTKAGIEKETIVLQKDYADDELIQIWLVPAGADPPKINN